MISVSQNSILVDMFGWFILDAFSFPKDKSRAIFGPKTGLR